MRPGETTTPGEKGKTRGAVTVVWELGVAADSCVSSSAGASKCNDDAHREVEGAWSSSSDAGAWSGSMGASKGNNVTEKKERARGVAATTWALGVATVLRTRGGVKDETPGSRTMAKDASRH